VTHGSQGADIYLHGEFWHVDAIPDVEVVEVTGCGDAFRAGYAYGILAGLAPDRRGQLGCVMAMLNLVTQETQNYHTSLAEVLALRDKHYD
jgi:adenosine kinase